MALDGIRRRRSSKDHQQQARVGGEDISSDCRMGAAARSCGRQALASWQFGLSLKSIWPCRTMIT